MYDRLQRRWLGFAGLAAGVVAGTACGDAPPAETPSTPLTCIAVKSTAQTNAGRPLHMLVRGVDVKTYREDSYAAVADKVVRPDPTVLGSTVLFAGREQTLSVRSPEEEDQAVAVYFMFTEPERDWKTLVDKPGPGLKITLGKNRITEVTSADPTAAACQPEPP